MASFRRLEGVELVRTRKCGKVSFETKREQYLSILRIYIISNNRLYLRGNQTGFLVNIAGGFRDFICTI